MPENDERKIEHIDDFCKQIDNLINLVEHPNVSQAVTKANADRYGDQINELAQKIWQQANFSKTGKPYQPTDVPDHMSLIGAIFGVTPEHKKSIIERWQHYKEMALAIKRSILKKCPQGKRQPWADDAPDYLENSEAVVKFTDGKLKLSRLSKILKPEGPIRYMRKGRRCKVHIGDFIEWCKNRFLTDKFANELADEVFAQREAIKEEIRLSSKK